MSRIVDLMYQKKKFLNEIYEQVLIGENFILFFTNGNYFNTSISEAIHSLQIESRVDTTQH